MKLFENFSVEIENEDQKLHDLVQLVRMSDVLLVGPMMLWGSSKLEMPKEAKALLAFMGCTTIVFNLLNFIRIETTGKTV